MVIGRDGRYGRHVAQNVGLGRSHVSAHVMIPHQVMAESIVLESSMKKNHVYSNLVV